VPRHIDRSRFSFIDPKPLASASVGQVHLARLKDDPEKQVVIKVVKKDFKRAFEKEVRTVKSFLRFVIFFYRKLGKVFDPVGVIEHIEEYTLHELDLTREAAGQETLKRLYEDNKERYRIPTLEFPKIYKELSSSDVLVSEYIEGKTFDQLLDEGGLGYDLLLRLFRIQGTFLFKLDAYHGDIHPGNIMLRNGEICYVDTGAIGHAGAKFQKGLLKMFRHLCSYDYPAAAEALHGMSELRIEGPAYEAYMSRFSALYGEFKGKKVKELSLTKQMMATIKLAVNSGMKFEKEMFPVIKNFMYMDGMVLRCNPDAVLLADMKGAVDEFSASA
jgi:ubiquinone biosynthesis protein